MAGIELEKGKAIYKSGQPMTAIHLITKGKVKVTYPGGVYLVGKGDVIGICEICSEIHFLDYETVEDTVILTYPMTSIDTLADMIQKHPDLGGLFNISAFRQISILLNRCDISELSCNNLYHELKDDYETYRSIAARYRLQPRELDGLDQFTSYISEETPDLWLNGYYQGLIRIFTGAGAKAVAGESGVSMGMLRKTSLDFRKAYMVLDDQYRYQQEIHHFYFNDTGEDLFECLTSLYYTAEQDSRDAASLSDIIHRMIGHTKSISGLQSPQIKNRTDSFLNHITLKSRADADKDTSGTGARAAAELAGSLNTILNYAGGDLELAPSFRQNIQAYKALEDKNSTEEEANKLRRSLTEEFYALYSVVFAKTLSQPDMPAPVRLFLYFGYVDEELAGDANCIVLYKLAQGMADTSSSGVYTFYHWLLAIYQGKKEPSRNEFDQDYNDFIHKQKAGGNITEAEMRSLENNTMSKVTFELRNMFPLVNKMTFGRITTYCPIFTSDNVLKELSSCYVTAAQTGHALERVRSIDFSAFYRETMDMEHLDVMGKEFIHLEYLPDIILMPNVGIRGVMWQEVEGKRRTSPSRMLFSIFHMEDLETSLIRLTGEYRWEMCKRIQGARWNDVSERSLTSEYFDYIQFYRKNHDLTTEAKERVRQSLQKAKNSFKEMFVRDYMIWILFEGTGSPRLNKVARGILFSYCPFPREICDTLQQNPLYAELLHRHRIHTAQRVHHLDVLIQKLRNSGSKIPVTLEAERRYAEK